MALTAPQVVLAGQGETDQKPRRERSGAISRGSTQAVQPFIPNEQQARDFFLDLINNPDLTKDSFWKNNKPDEAFVNLLRHAPIKGLDLTEKNISAEIMKAIAPALPMTLQEIDLSRNNIGDEGAKALAQHLPATIQKITLNFNNIGDEGAEALAQHLPATLRWLSLVDNNIGDEGAKALAQHLPQSLTWLYLDGNNMGDKGLTALRDTIPGTNLGILSISLPEGGALLRKDFENLHSKAPFLNVRIFPVSTIKKTMEMLRKL